MSLTSWRCSTRGASSRRAPPRNWIGAITRSYERSCGQRERDSRMVSGKTVGAGAFVIISVLLFTAALFMIGERRMLFENRFEVYTEFAALGQLEAGAIVRVAGMNAGEVTDIQVPDSPTKKFRVKMEVRDDLHPLVRTDSVASAQTEGLVGGIYVSIATGTQQAPQVPEKGTIPSREPFALSDLLAQASDTIAQVNMTVEKLSGGDLETTIDQIEMTTEDAHQLFIDISPKIQAIVQNGNRITADTQQIVAGLQAGEGTIGKLLKDDALYQRARDIADEAKGVMANVRQVSEEARLAISDFRSKDGPAQGLVADMRVTLGQAREGTADLADNMEAMKHNFLLRGFFNRRGYFDLNAISPDQYRSGVLENGKRKAMRIWLSSAVLFESGPGGGEVLTADGRARIDSAMSTYLKYVPSNPLVVEGYATEGTTGERFRLSGQRAGLVREYVLGRYKLMPQNTGFIALGDAAPGSPAGERWDGVSLTLFLEASALQFTDQQVAR
ncbi:MAG: MCE family protein [Acidobacteria bacterium]|nr:MCE family protein [Acidobacteriota bacterium]